MKFDIALSSTDALIMAVVWHKVLKVQVFKFSMLECQRASQNHLCRKSLQIRLVFRISVRNSWIFK